MKKVSILLCLLLVTLTGTLAASGNPSSRIRFNNIKKKVTPVENKLTSTEKKATGSGKYAELSYDNVRQQYAKGAITADSVVTIALSHKAESPATAERFLQLVADKNPRAKAELGAIYAFTPEYSGRVNDGVALLQQASQSGSTQANCYLGLYYYNHKDYKKAKAYLEDHGRMEYGIGNTILGSMYTSGNGVKEDLVKAREYFHRAALEGYPRGMALYGFNLRAKAGGPINYPDSFYWLYIAGDLGDDAARSTLALPLLGEKRADTEVGRDATTALQFIQTVQQAKKIQNDPLYKDGFLPSLKAREAAAENGDDWARYYLGSMNYNGDFLNQNDARAIYYYEAIARNGKLPAAVLDRVKERLARLHSKAKK